MAVVFAAISVPTLAFSGVFRADARGLGDFWGGAGAKPPAHPLFPRLRASLEGQNRNHPAHKCSFEEISYANVGKKDRPFRLNAEAAGLHPFSYPP
jgi:hypothetical protein